MLQDTEFFYLNEIVMPLLKGSVLDDAKNKVNIALSLEKLNILNA